MEDESEKSKAESSLPDGAPGSAGIEKYPADFVRSKIVEFLYRAPKNIRSRRPQASNIVRFGESEWVKIELRRGAEGLKENLPHDEGGGLRIWFLGQSQGWG